MTSPKDSKEVNNLGLIAALMTHAPDLFDEKMRSIANDPDLIEKLKQSSALDAMVTMTKPKPSRE